jgi:hypothetical protein
LSCEMMRYRLPTRTLGHLQPRSTCETQMNISPRLIVRLRLFLKMLWTLTVNLTHSLIDSLDVIWAWRAETENIEVEMKAN